MKHLILSLIAGASLAAMAGGIGAAQAQGAFLDEYVAFLGPDDHFNSNGQRLTEPWQVIRQDRANYYKGIRDPGDEGDGYFSDIANRALMEQMVLHGRIDPRARSQIVNQNVWIRVQVYEDAVNITVE